MAVGVERGGVAIDSVVSVATAATTVAVAVSTASTAAGTVAVLATRRRITFFTTAGWVPEMSTEAIAALILIYDRMKSWIGFLL
jgi:hypothetical protein